MGLGSAAGYPADRTPAGRRAPGLTCLVVPQVELGPRPAVERASPVTEEEWASHVGPEGRLQRVPELRARMFSGVRRRCGEGWAGPGQRVAGGCL